MFLGLNGIVIKSHGGTDEVGFKSALGLAYEMARSRLIDKIGEGMQRFPALDSAAAPAADRTGGETRVTDKRSIVRGVGGYLPEQRRDQ